MMKKPKKYAPRPSRYVDGLNWRDMLNATERPLVERYEQLIGANPYLAKWHDLPPEIAKIRDRCTSRLLRKRKGKNVGTGQGGHNNTNAKLDWQKVREIRRSGDRYTDLAARYGVSLSTIKDVRRGRLWPEREGEKYPRSGWLKSRRGWETRRRKADAAQDNSPSCESDNLSAA